MGAEADPNPCTHLQSRLISPCTQHPSWQIPMDWSLCSRALFEVHVEDCPAGSLSDTHALWPLVPGLCWWPCQIKRSRWLRLGFNARGEIKEKQCKEAERGSGWAGLKMCKETSRCVQVCSKCLCFNTHILVSIVVFVFVCSHCMWLALCICAVAAHTFLAFVTVLLLREHLSLWLALLHRVKTWVHIQLIIDYLQLLPWQMFFLMNNEVYYL